MLSNFDCAVNFAKGEGQKKANRCKWEFITDDGDRKFTSFATPIAYICKGLMIIDEKHYSRTTTEHQNCLKNAASIYGYKVFLTEHPKNAYNGLKAKGSFNDYHSEVISYYLAGIDANLDYAFDAAHHATRDKYIRIATEYQMKLEKYYSNLIDSDRTKPLEDRLVMAHKKVYRNLMHKKDKAMHFKPSRKTIPFPNQKSK